MVVFLDFVAKNIGNTLYCPHGTYDDTPISEGRVSILLCQRSTLF
jgi:hypothetical protein